MTVTLAAIVGIAVGVVAGLLLSRLLVVREREPTVRSSEPQPGVTPADALLERLPTAAVLVDADGAVRYANTAARDLALVRRGSLGVPELDALVADVRRTGRPQQAQLGLSTGGLARRETTVRARAEQLADGEVALVVDDLTESSRVESVRRDFVANVGHEIKTPVGALALLSEAALEAQDDPEAVRRFLGRLQREAQRLSRLVQELLDLSRLQGGEPLPEPTRVPLDRVVEEAVDRARPAADAKRIAMVTGGDLGVHVAGDEAQLVTALSNLIDNAVAYSGDGTRVALGVRHRDGVVEISVSDEGIGIDRADLDRIFERFYRVDPARSRATGGTGLGLSIVKHIVTNHGGDVSAWSRPGEGSTFTVRLPVVEDDDVTEESERP